MALQAMFSPIGMADDLYLYKNVYEVSGGSYNAEPSGPWILLKKNYKFSFTSTRDPNLFACFRIKMPASLKENEYSFVDLIDDGGAPFAKLTLDRVGRISLHEARGSGFSTVPSSTSAPTKPGFSPNETVDIQIRCWSPSPLQRVMHLKLNDKLIPPITITTLSKWEKIEFKLYSSTSSENADDVMSFTDLLLCDGSGSDFNDFLPFVPQIEMADFSLVKAKPKKNIFTRSSTCGYSSSLLNIIRRGTPASFCFSSQTSSYLGLPKFTAEACISRDYSSGKIPFKDNQWFFGWSTIPSRGAPPVGLGLTFQNDGTEIALVERKLGDDANSPVTVHMSGTMPPAFNYGSSVFSVWHHIALVYRNPVMLLYVDGERVAREGKLSFINDESDADKILDICWMDYMGACRVTADERYKGRSPTLDEIPFATGADDPSWSDVIYLADFDKRLILTDRPPYKAVLPCIVPPREYSSADIRTPFEISQLTNVINPLTLDVSLKNHFNAGSPYRGVLLYGDPSNYELTFQVKPSPSKGQGWKAIQSFVVADQDGKDPNKDKWYCTVDVNNGAYTSAPHLIFDGLYKSFVGPVAMSDSGYQISIKTSA